jgi:hypothetical protein
MIITSAGIKTIELINGEYLHFWYANNAGRGTDNCTIIRSTAPRAPTSKAQTNVIAITTTSAWRGRVNLSTRIEHELGI